MYNYMNPNLPSCIKFKKIFPAALLSLHGSFIFNENKLIYLSKCTISLIFITRFCKITLILLNLFMEALAFCGN